MNVLKSEMGTQLTAMTLEEMEMLKKKAALERLEVAINTFDDEACFLKLSEDGKTVTIQFIGGGEKIANIHGDSGVAMLYDVLKQALWSNGVIAKKRSNDRQSGVTMDKAE